ncbi:DUF5412 domain-containing protein [Sporosarcina sp. A2]|uniref:DUF5412 domain-containing protein n=1 Tax=Sporosarcina sp. A2 TaxID=3393449 RepID=UPI003D798C35
MKHQKAVADSERKRVRKIVLRFLLAIGLLIVVLAGYAFYWIFFDMNHFPTGEFLTEESSPNGAYTVKAFVTDGGATTSYAIRGELVSNEKNNMPKTIYWNYREDSAEIIWQDNHTVVINGHVLDVRKDKYDFRRE